jgi:hypothetical protein
MARKFAHEDAFPLIARLIRAVHETTQAFVNHDEFVAAVLADPSGKALVGRQPSIDG